MTGCCARSLAGAEVIVQADNLALLQDAAQMVAHAAAEGTIRLKHYPESLPSVAELAAALEEIELEQEAP
jgi:hypothetical protein